MLKIYDRYHNKINLMYYDKIILDITYNLFRYNIKIL